MPDLFAVDQRFWSKVAIGEPDECWEWQAARFTSTGYGLFEVDDVSRGAHRIAALLAFGPSGDDFVLHSCDNRSCVNPRHLRYGTQKDNMADRRKRGGYAREVLMKRNPSKATPEARRLWDQLDPGATFAKADGPGYDWASLLDGRTWELVQGEDFTCTMRAFRTQAYRNATQAGKQAQVSIRDDRLYLRATEFPTLLHPPVIRPGATRTRVSRRRGGAGTSGDTTEEKAA